MSLERVREICDELPEVEVVEDGDHHTLRVKRRTLGWHTVGLAGDGRESLVVRVEDPILLVSADPDRFFHPPVGGDGFVGLRLDSEYVGWDEVRELLVGAYRLTAPGRLVRRLGS